jgi:hypothetical protein
MSCPITRFRVLRGTVHQMFSPSATCSSDNLGDGGGHRRMEVNETETETSQRQLSATTAPILGRPGIDHLGVADVLVPPFQVWI